MPDSSSPLRVLLAGGGTAGHVNPLLATAHALVNEHGATVRILGTREGLEARLVPQAGYEMSVVDRVPLPRKPSADLLKLPARLKGAINQAKVAIRAVNADVVVGFGGYVSTPAYLAAKSLGIPVVIHEQNARPGLANKVGARTAKAVALTFESTPLTARRGETSVVGMPLRKAIEDLAADLRDPAKRGARRAHAAQQLGMDPSMPTVLITGGSLGAQHINEAVCGVIEAGLPGGIQVLHLTGCGKDQPVRDAVEKAGVGERYKVLDYLNDMDQALSLATAVVCRSGAGTVAELTAVGLPAMYVPLPIGNGEQKRNCADVVAAGGGIMVPDAQCTPETLGEFMAGVCDDQRMLTMSRNAAQSGVVDGASRLASIVAAQGL
ncbi:undecaprenyldiphospho-muramoylpentapeptide beta-N-acetylglucosaminyltransferase [Actinomyces vulturis]|uniref:undecaprenyldiphospho-muramoylpentapeptide beta-N-acetylglucosaminyltransferase n=1 Tax=Actinomyces vulturis TaxID=1857645 RepID=UPI0009F1F1A8|nr:undecaprenyldiphospho-muramoylpentapeptide beta-N-acetylglucosaminyltransferase [Actinomyces vulturis]